ncbi:AI-2E family transporter [Lysobacter sp. SG-8]|uniref:AI-2E family transporter n=1 Tax=Marilutibacter penaei TaxID=2759900 RepID=A0A7W3U1A3_9GAMM|nr:AI-2E family transporter [Lysobacter penaei]MBB1087116.1 AI-2E family transporter [Lysobacter penaei]
MSDTPPAPPSAPPADVTPPPARPRSSSAMIVLATLAVAFTAWAAQGLILPILLGMFFALVGNPILRGLQKLWIPRFLGALLIVIGGLGATGLLALQLAEPASEWMRQVPREMRDLAPKLRELAKPVQDANEVAADIARAAGGDTGRAPQVVRTEVNDPYRSLTATPKMAAQVLAVILLTLFFMIYGDHLVRGALALLPGRQQKKVTVEILHSIERAMSRYVLTITLINTAMGLVLAGVLYAIGVPLSEALLWGTMAAILNFAPYVGPLIGMLVMLLMGFVAFDALWQSLLPAGLYLAIHTIEGQVITPVVLGQRMRLSPLVLVLALMVAGWMWGIVGLLLAVPIVVCVKLVLERIEGLDGWARLLE